MLEDQTHVQPDALKAYIATIKADSARLMAQLAATEARADKATADLTAMAQQLAGLTTQLSQCETQLAGEKARADQAIAELTALTQRIAEQRSRPRWLSWRRPG